MAENDERARVGRVLHDNLQQLLYGIQLKMALLAEEAATAKQEHLKAYADEAQHWIRDAVNTTRQLTVDLSPPLLSEDNLGDALEWLQSQMRELLFNVVKHARTDRVVVTAREIDDDGAPQLAIEVRDDGCGFEPNELAASGTGFGLAHVRGRLELFGGRLELESKPGAGTRATVYLPRTTASTDELAEAQA